MKEIKRQRQRWRETEIGVCERQNTEKEREKEESEDTQNLNKDNQDGVRISNKDHPNKGNPTFTAEFSQTFKELIPNLFSLFKII